MSTARVPTHQEGAVPREIQSETLPDRPSDVRPVDVAVLARIAGADLNPGSGPGPALDAAARPVTGVTLRAAEVRPGDLFAAAPSTTWPPTWWPAADA